MESKPEEKWEGKFSAKLLELKAEQVWPLIEDYCNVHRWLPTADNCHLVEGIAGQLGCVRYCSKSSASLDGSDGAINWATERLIAVDAKERYITYEIVENNVGFGSYVATMKVLAGEGPVENDGCEIEWSFVADPVAGWKQEGLIAFLESNLQGMAKRIEEALLVSK
ncbi:hypothetical protein Syun_011459 [Stephania yunnanensis]|uniref:Lachrymatory factor synthase n=1 Tax=Stephania yunnanensis TaxID=152371 RepID=A0AAP0PGH5_9MAGN